MWRWHFRAVESLGQRRRYSESVVTDTFQGKQDVVERLAGPLLGQFESPGTLEAANIIAEGDYVVIQAQASGRMTKTGRPYNNTYCMVIRLADGQVTEVDEYCDTELITSAFGSK